MEVLLMNVITRVVLGLVKLALAIGFAGGLTDLTQTMREEAVKAHQQGLVSLKQLNSSLVEAAKVVHGRNKTWP
jgi:hypothetical protein